MVQLTRNTGILVKTESTYRTDPTPTAATNAMAVSDFQLTEQEPPAQRPAQVGNLSRLPSILGERSIEMSFKIENLGSGVAGTAPRLGALLRACGFGETVLSSTSVTYEPITDSIESCTIWAYIGGRLHKITGCRGTVKAVCEAGQFMSFEFNMMGYRSAAPTVATIPTLTLDSTTAVCKGGTLSYNSKTTLTAKTFMFDMANTVSKVMDLSDANALFSFEITDRNPSAEFDPVTQVETSYDFRADVLTNQRVLSYAVGSFLTINIPQFNPFAPEYTDDEGILRDKIAGEMAQTSGNDEINLVYTG